MERTAPCPDLVESRGQGAAVWKLEQVLTMRAIVNHSVCLCNLLSGPCERSGLAGHNQFGRFDAVTGYDSHDVDPGGQFPYADYFVSRIA